MNSLYVILIISGIILFLSMMSLAIVSPLVDKPRQRTLKEDMDELIKGIDKLGKSIDELGKSIDEAGNKDTRL